jgi:hypothetical protein
MGGSAIQYALELLSLFLICLFAPIPVRRLSGTRSAMSAQTSLSLLRHRGNSIRLGVGEAEWAFKTEFQAPETSLASKHADLTFEGLDTYATVSLVSLTYLSQPTPAQCFISERSQNS